MKRIDIAQIECRSPDGSPVASVTLTPDMDEPGQLELAPIVHVPTEAAAEHGVTEFQLRENGRYYYDIDRGSDTRDLRLRCHLARRRRNLKHAASDAGRLETGAFCGTLLLEIVEGDASDYSKPAIAAALVDEEDSQNPGNYKRQDLLKMHAYTRLSSGRSAP